MQAYIDVSSRSHFSKYYLKPLLSSVKLEMMFPDKPKNKNQKYTTVHSNYPRSRALGLISHCPASFHSKLYSLHLPIHPILDRKFQTLYLSQQPDRSQRQPHRANQKCHNQQNCTILRGIGNKHSHAKNWLSFCQIWSNHISPFRYKKIPENLDFPGSFALRPSKTSGFSRSRASPHDIK